MALPAFLDLPRRTSKPRSAGLTHVLDKGMPAAELRGWLELCGHHIDVWKLGWGTSYLDPTLEAKVALLAEHGVQACAGGTLLEVAWMQDRSQDCLSWLAATGFTLVEVSNGAVPMPAADKRRLIELAAERLPVLAEVGSKNPHVDVSGALWAQEAADDLAAGATWTLAEGRESGTVGLYGPDGSVRHDVAEGLVGAVGLDRVIFEAPVKHQQTWLIGRYGVDVNVGNVSPADVLGLETLRLGLRADTVGMPGTDRLCGAGWR